MRSFTKSLLCAAASLFVSASVQAATLVPGSVLIPASAELEPAGGVILASVSTGFSVPGSFSGTLYTDVIAGDASNPFGGLTFVYRLVNDGVAGSNSIGRITVGSFLGFATDASYNPSAGVAPSSLDRIPAISLARILSPCPLIHSRDSLFQAYLPPD
jgi:hypothetical protein